MKENHEQIKSKLPEYIRGDSLPDEIDAHLKECSECRNEASLLRDLLHVPVPEPGGMFFDTLPQKVRASLSNDRKSPFFRLAPAFGLIALLIITGFIYYVIKTPDTAEDLYSFIDPLTSQIYDLSDVQEDDIPSAIEIIEGEERLLSDVSLFSGEFAYLSADEMETIYETINTQ
jgi:hypothetical protein